MPENTNTEVVNSDIDKEIAETKLAIEQLKEEIAQKEKDQLIAEEKQAAVEKKELEEQKKIEEAEAKEQAEQEEALNKVVNDNQKQINQNNEQLEILIDGQNVNEEGMTYSVVLADKQLEQLKDRAGEYNQYMMDSNTALWALLIGIAGIMGLLKPWKA